MVAEDPTTFELLVPSSADGFEELCLDLWERIWTDPNIQRLGVSGQGQHGIDIYSRVPGDTGKHRVIQCKKYWRTRLTPKKIDVIVSDVLKSPLMPISELIIATTQPGNARIQEYVAAIARTNVAAGLFDVHIFSWNNICSLLRNYPEVLRLHYKDMFGLSAANASLAIGDILLDEVKQRLADRKFSEALHILDAFVQKQQVMDNNTRFRVLTNKGVILSMIGRNAEAAENLLQAYTFNKTSEIAGTNAAQASLMTGDRRTATRIAKSVIKMAPGNTLAYRVLVLATATFSKAKSLVSRLSNPIHQSGDVLFALGLVAQRESDWDNAADCFQKSLDAYGHVDAMTCAFLAVAIMQKIRHESERDPELADSPTMRAATERAQQLLSTAIENPSQVPEELLSACYSNRCHAHIWLGDIEGAARDADTFTKMSPDRPANKKLMATILYMRHDINGAIQALRSIADYRDTPDALDMLARLLDSQQRYQEALDAVDQVLDLPEKPSLMATLAKHFRIHLLRKLNRTGDARGYADALLSHDPENPLWMIDVCLCLCAAGADSHESSLETTLEKVVTLTTSEIPPIVRDEISKTMETISRLDLSIEIDKIGFAGDVYNTRSRRLLHGYLTLGRFADAKSLCDTLVRAGVQRSEVYWYRAQLNTRSGNLDAAEADLQACLIQTSHDGASSEHTEIVLLLAEVQLENQHSADALASMATIKDLPSLTSPQFDRLVGLWIRLKEYTRALDAAYARLLDPTHGTEPETFQTYIRCFLTIDRVAPEVLEPEDVVGQNSAVLLELSPGEQVWYLPDPVRRTRMGNAVFLLPGDRLWQSLLGKKAGDTGKMGSILQIAGRHAAIINEAFTSYVRQFPDRNDLERVPLTAPNDSTSISEQFKAHIADAASFGAHVRRILTAQREGQIPFSQVSHVLSHNPVELFQEIAATPGEYVLAVLPGTPPQPCNDSVAALVVDPLTSLTLAGIPAFSNGVAGQWSIVYTRATLDVLMEASAELKAYIKHGMKSLVSLDGKHFTITTVSPEIVQQRQLQVERTIAWLQGYASLTPCSLILQYGEDKYQQAISVLGRAEVEAIALAQEPRHALLSDELVLRTVARSEGAMSFSTQDILLWAREENLLSQPDYAAGLFELYQNHMRGVYCDVQTVATLCDSVEWNAKLLPNNLLGVLSADNAGSTGPSAAGKLAYQIFMNVLDGSTRCSEWWPMLLGAVASGRKEKQAFQVMMQSMDAEFHHVVTLATNELGEMASIWLKTGIVS